VRPAGGFIGFMSGNQQHPDIMCEVFILAPTDLLDDEEARRIARRSPTDRRGVSGSRVTARGGCRGRSLDARSTFGVGGQPL
jgi:hypothetical protein